MPHTGKKRFGERVLGSVPNGFNSEECATAIDDFLNGDMTLPYLKKLYPFVYSEIVRQGLDHAARRRIRTLCVANLRYEI